jgi:polyisoprenoid-binding protein YceI
MTNGTDDVDAAPASLPAETSARRRRRRWPYWLGGAVLVVGATAGWYVWQQYRTLTSSKYSVVAYTVPQAPPLVAQSGETVYRIDPTHSSVSYTASEKLFGQDASEAHGTTNGIAGDLAINHDDPSRSRVGQIVVNVEQLHSDNSLRDAKMREGNLESHRYPLANLAVGSLSGLPSTLVEGRTYHFAMPSQLTVKERPAAVTWQATARVEGGRLYATAETDVKMSTFGIGPISIAGLVSTGDDVHLELKLTALDPAKFTVPTAIPTPLSAPRSGDSPSFQRVVLPAMEANCASCHVSGQVGAAHWKFDTAGDAHRIADGIGTVVDAGYMPPWPASTVGVPLAHSKRLDRATVDEIVKWAKAGGPLDVPEGTKVKVRPGPTPPPPRRDAVMKMPEGYAGSSSVPNDYRCFVLDPHLTKPMYMTGYQVTPGVRREIHHAQIFHQNAAQAARSVARSGQDGKPGWSCYSSPDGVARRTKGGGFTGQAGLVAGWVPGQDPVTYPLHSGILMQPGDVLILQMHYHYDTAPVPDRSTVAIQLDPPDRGVKELTVVNPIAPVEIPCMPGETAALCDRSAAIADDARLYGPFGSAVEAGLLGLCGKTSDELAATFKNGIASSSCEYRVPEDGTMIGVLGHMHTLGKSFRMTLDPATPTQKVLLDIPTWNFDWQMNYELAKPIHVTKGQKILMQCSWDRSLDPNRPPKYIVFAEGTEDEMCFGTYGLIPDDQSTNVPGSG